MKKIQDIPSLFSQVQEDPLNGFVLTKPLQKLAHTLIALEKGFNDVSPHYSVQFSASVYYIGHTGLNLDIKLKYDGEDILDVSTSKNFVKYGNSGDYVRRDSHSGISQEISLAKKPELYIEILENEFISVFLNHEKSLAIKNAQRLLNESIHSSAPTSIKPPRFKQ